ncbi:MAG: SUMF1/EgtB/PvdO family nonheme iron enzyme [Gammaproteobacteria bacterium]|nr:SUMF1/EgtB/PvdO family nonheme iron enzyme [Gammaproteobacteria bacterium]MBU1656191.1 SUMF1/EgtB/PvdO family nonheme iron enzyme [Gammaproteobacteria bacterium]MBU1960479.1 SUMF1/EgtB/PvdO family nonheme iron enzyme [Gammaproteobacteria bacterium]
MLNANDSLQLKQGEYRLLEPLKQGGQGEIWRVSGPEGGEYALKTVLIQRDDDSRVWVNIANIRAEIESLERLGGGKSPLAPLSQGGDKNVEDPFIIPCLDAGHWRHPRFGDVPAFVMPLMAGSLKDAEAPLDGDTLLRWAGQIAHAIGQVQALDGVSSHRDLKPSNLLLTHRAGGDLRLIDFGIAKAGAEELTDAPHRDREFFAPEQILPVRPAEGNGGNGEGLFDIGPACDLYNLGLILYWLIMPDHGLPEAQYQLPVAAKSRDHLEGIAKGGPGLLGEIGGLTTQERTRLQRRLLDLFGGNSDATLMMTAIRSLPDLEQNADRMAAWVERLLSPSPADRPRAGEAEAGFAQLRQALRPRIDRLEVGAAVTEIEAGQPLAIEVRVAGEGLPSHGKWLGLSLDGTPLSLEPETPETGFVTGEGTLRYRWTPAIGDAGERQLQVRCQVSGERRAAEALLRVSVTAEQLWAAGRRLEAVEREPREVWLDQLEAEAVKPRQWVAFMDVLHKLQGIHPENERLGARLERLEGAAIRLGRRAWWKKSPPTPLYQGGGNRLRGLVLLLAITAIGGAGYGIWWQAEEWLALLSSLTAPAKPVPPSSPSGEREPPRLGGMTPAQVRALQHETAQGLGLPLNPDGFSFSDCPGCPSMAVLPAGAFRMGDTAGGGGADERWEDGEASRGLSIGRPFAMAVTEVTLRQFAAFVADKDYHRGQPFQTLAEQDRGCYIWEGGWQKQWGLFWRNSGFEQSPDHPVTCVGRRDMAAYAQWLRRKSGRHYRLPTEAEWEYAARAGLDTRYAWGDEPPRCEAGQPNGAQFSDPGRCRAEGSRAVAGFQPNRFGLYDMGGNVAEWSCSAYTDALQSDAATACAPAGKDEGRYSVRGGSWGNGAKAIRVSGRTPREPQARDIYTGFRLVAEF